MDEPSAFDESSLDALEVEVDDIEKAIARLADGSYRTCEVCAEPLAPELLADHPAARLCPAHLPVVSG